MPHALSRVTEGSTAALRASLTDGAHPRRNDTKASERAGTEASGVALWQKARLPSGYEELWCEELGSPSGLAQLRRRLRRETTGSPTVVDPARDHWAERLVLIADELTSNALRHGGGPVATALCRTEDEWLISVSDHSPHVPPVPAQGRDPGRGGHGLYLIAELSVRHGWSTHRGMKTVWAVVAAD